MNRLAFEEADHAQDASDEIDNAINEEDMIGHGPHEDEYGYDEQTEAIRDERAALLHCALSLPQDIASKNEENCNEDEWDDEYSFPLAIRDPKYAKNQLESQ